MPSPGSATKQCVFCHTLLNVACKTCKACKSEQPRKLTLRKKIDKFDQKRERWVQTHRRNRNSSRVRDQSFMLLEKLHALGVKAVMLISKPGRKPNVWMSEVLTPRCQLTETSNTCLQRMKDVFDIVIQGWTPQCAAEQLDEPSSAPAGPQMPPQDLHLAMTLLPPPAFSIGPLMAPSRPPAALTTTLAASTEPPAASSVCLAKDQQREIRIETVDCPAPPSAPAATSHDIKSETEDFGSTSIVNPSSSTALLVTVTDPGFACNMNDVWEDREETEHYGEKEKERKRRKMGPEMQRHREVLRCEASGQPFVSGNITDVTSLPIQRAIKEEDTEEMCGYPPTKSLMMMVEYDNTYATNSGHRAGESQVMEKRIPPTAQASVITHLSDMVEAPSSAPSSGCDLDAMDLDQLKREKLKMQIKVLRLQEEYYTQKIKGHKT